nr:uncharacterized protein LOC127295645 isoform X3 [Lolium perenne]
MAKIKSVNQFEQEFMEHIDVLRHAHGEGDNELETVYMKALADMRRDIKEKELNALLSGDRDPYPCFIERSEAHQPGLRLQRSCEDWRSNLPCIYQTESGIWGLHFNQKHASYVTSSQCSPELFHTNCLEGSQGELCHVIAMFTGAVSHKLLRRFSGYGSRVPSGYAFSCADAIHFRVQPSHPNTWEEKRLRGQIGYRRPMRFRVVASTPARGHAGAVLAGGGQRTREEGCWPEERQDPLGRRDIYMFAISWPNSRMPESRGTTAWTREGIMSYQLFSIECDYSTQ